MSPSKDYQSRTLKTLGDFLRRCSKPLPVSLAFLEAQAENNVAPTGYIPVAANGLSPEMPLCVPARADRRWQDGDGGLRGGHREG